MELDLQNYPWLRVFTQNPWNTKLRFMCIQKVSTINPQLKFTNIQEKKLSNRQALKFSQKLTFLTQAPYFHGFDATSQWKNDPFVFSLTGNTEQIKMKVKYNLSKLNSFYLLTTAKFNGMFSNSPGFQLGYVNKTKFRYDIKLKVSVASNYKLSTTVEKKFAANWAFRISGVLKVWNFRYDQCSIGFGISYSFGGSQNNNNRQMREIRDNRGEQIIQIREVP